MLDEGRGLGLSIFPNHVSLRNGVNSGLNAHVCHLAPCRTPCKTFRFLLLFLLLFFHIQQTCGCSYRHCEGKRMGYRGIITDSKISTLMVGEPSCKTRHKGITERHPLCPQEISGLTGCWDPWPWCRLPDHRYTVCRCSTSSGVSWSEMSGYIL